MLGAIIGDIVGSIYEFSNTKNFSFSPLFGEMCSFTDDSIMTCAVADWLMTDERHTEQALEDSMVKYGKLYPSPMGGYGISFRTWLLSPEDISNCDTGVVNSTGKRIPYNSCGNGSAMRVSAVGWAANSVNEVMKIAKRSAEITHNHPEGIKGAQAVALCVYFARMGKDKTFIKDYIEKEFDYNLSMPVEEIRERYSWNGIDGRGDSGCCQDSVPQAISCALQSKDFETAIRNAISIGGDSDTIGCITGGIAEALYGIPTNIMACAIDKCLPYRLKNILKEFAQKYDVVHVKEYFDNHPLANPVKGKKFEI